jgi:hypothetical protein
VADLEGRDSFRRRALSSGAALQIRWCTFELSTYKAQASWNVLLERSTVWDSQGR